ncbi:MAG: hypothetical protein IPM36_01815 [Lewinellaceae bacterium]|nr:hypothetical protein [Lewinellaceae bacterium]
MKPTFVLLLIFSLFFSHSFAQTRWYVRAGASPVGADASSWATATPFLQDALDAAQFGDTVWVSQGLYKPGSGIDRYAAFVLRNGIRVFGGFAGTETQLNQRDWAAHPTVLSGDIGAPNDSTDNSYNLLYLTKTGMSTRIDGIVLERANANNPDNVNVFAHERGHSGSAIYLDGQGAGNFAYLTLANCTIRNNRADHFGAVYANGRDNGKTAVRIENCRVENNQAFFKGGALVVENYALQPEAFHLENTVFSQNFGRIGGGALYAEHHQVIQIQGCHFEKNSVFAGSGGAVSLFGTNLSHTVRFDGCVFSENFTTGNLDGGAVDYFPSNSVTGLQFFNCSFLKNSASEGGCVNILNGDSYCPLRFEQCRFIQNTAGPGSVLAATLLAPLGELRFRQCLFFENSESELFLAGNSADTVLLQNSILQKTGGNAPFFGRNQPLRIQSSLINRPDCSHFGPAALCDTTAIFNGNPFFADPLNGDFHLNPCSQAINAGDNALAAGLGADLDGQPRIRAGRVDLGPYEHDLGFVPTQIIPASCPDSPDGAVVFGGSNCAPVFISWSMGGAFGTRTDSLVPGAYVFSFIDAAGHAAIDTVVIPSLPPLMLLPSVAAPTCAGGSNGVAGVSISGGTGPVQIVWENGNSGNFLFSVPAGTYPVTVTDALGCVATTSIEVPGAPEIEVYYTVTPATGPMQADGAIQIDSLLTCMGVYSWTGPAQTGLLPGNYTTTLTDPCGCFTLFTAEVGFTVGTATAGNDTPAFWLAPNPVQAGQEIRLHWTGGDVPESVWLVDALGRVVQRVGVPPGAEQVGFPSPPGPGAYRVVVWAGKRILEVLVVVVV